MADTMIVSFGKAEEKEITKLEKKLKTILPEDYRAFLARSNGGCTDEIDDIVVFPVHELDETVALDALFGVGLSEDFNIKDWCDEFKDDLLDNMVIIGNAIETGMLLLINQQDWKGIYFWDDGLDYEASTEDECIYKIADSFDEFMGLLAREK